MLTKIPIIGIFILPYTKYIILTFTIIYFIIIYVNSAIIAQLVEQQIRNL